METPNIDNRLLSPDKDVPYLNPTIIVKGSAAASICQVRWEPLSIYNVFFDIFFIRTSPYSFSRFILFTVIIFPYNYHHQARANNINARLYISLRAASSSASLHLEEIIAYYSSLMRAINIPLKSISEIKKSFSIMCTNTNSMLYT